ncbi:unnamed protein product [Alopecurus aequalis]
MAPSIAIAIAAPATSGGWKGSKKAVMPAAESVAVQADTLRRRNAGLEGEVAALRAEEAEERLCAQLGEAESEAVELARELVAARGHAAGR